MHPAHDITMVNTTPIIRQTVIPMPAYPQLVYGQDEQQSTTSCSSSGRLGFELDALTANRKDKIISGYLCQVAGIVWKGGRGNIADQTRGRKQIKNKTYLFLQNLQLFVNLIFFMLLIKIIPYFA